MIPDNFFLEMWKHIYRNKSNLSFQIMVWRESANQLSLEGLGQNMWDWTIVKTKTEYMQK